MTRSLSFAERVRRPWTLGDGVWADNSVLQLIRPGEARSYWVFWRGAHEEFLAWYVNLQEPLRRSPVGFDTADHVLDIEVEPDLTWRWKDEDEFAEAQQLGLFTHEEAAAIRAEGEAAITVIEAAGHSPKAGRPGGPILRGRRLSCPRAGTSCSEPRLRCVIDGEEPVDGETVPADSNERTL